jgi:transcriptional regulator with GAF, ATPase, and Fis domain
MFANAIHKAGPRRDKPFVAINCAAIPKEMLEAELFGYRKGAFTGADREYAGAFEQADGGTLFLDEVGDCDPAMQVKLLRVLQPPPDAGPCQRVIRRVGESKERLVDVRIVAATNRDLKKAVIEHSFREDLYYRLAVITIKLPSLRERRGDIPLLAKGLLDQINSQFSKEPGYQDKRISGPAMELVKKHDWPGNVRELYNVLLQAAVMAGGSELHRADIAAAIAEMPGSSRLDSMETALGDGFGLEEHLDRIERHLIERAMHESKGIKAKATHLLGLKSYQALDAKLKRLKVDWRAPENVE